MPDAPVGMYGNIWNTDDDGDANPNDTDTSAGTAEDTESYEDIDPKLTKYLVKELEKREQALVEAIEKGDPTSKVYKGLQRRLNERDQELKQLRAELQQAREAASGATDLISGVREGVQWLTNTTLEALDETSRDKAVANLQQRRLALMQEQMARAMQQQAPPPQRGQPREDDETEAYLRRAREEFVEGRRKTAKQFGVDPERLDYGSEDEPFTTRLSKFEESLARAVEEAAVEGVRQRRQPEPTRTSGGTAGRAPMDLDSAAALRLQEIARGKYGR